MSSKLAYLKEKYGATVSGADQRQDSEYADKKDTKKKKKNKKKKNDKKLKAKAVNPSGLQIRDTAVVAKSVHNTEVSVGPFTSVVNDTGASPSRRRMRHDSDGDSDASPPRRRMRHDSDGDSDASPPRRRMRHDSDDDSDASPPRRRMRHDSDGDSDASPPRRRMRHDSDDDSDASPPRRRMRHDSDGGSDASPPRRRMRHDSDDDSDASPPRRRMRHDSDADDPITAKSKQTSSVSITSKTSALEPPSNSNLTESTESETTKSNDKPRMRFSGTTAGLKSGETFAAEMREANARKNRNLSDAELAVLGKGSETVYRDRFGKKVNVVEAVEEQRRTDAMKKAIDNKRLHEFQVAKKDREDREEQMKQLAQVKAEPFARSAADASRELQDRVRADDPMAKYIAESKNKGNKRGKPVYNGPTLANRFMIQPGYRWDGVDRSNGFEKRILAKLNSADAKKDEAYIWSVADM